MKPYVDKVKRDLLYGNFKNDFSFAAPELLFTRKNDQVINLRLGIISIDDSYSKLNKNKLDKNKLDGPKIFIDSAKELDKNIYSKDSFITIPFNVKFSDNCYESYFDINLGVYIKSKIKDIDNILNSRRLQSAFVSVCCNFSYNLLNTENIENYIEDLLNELNL